MSETVGLEYKFEVGGGIEVKAKFEAQVGMRSADRPPSLGECPIC